MTTLSIISRDQGAIYNEAEAVAFFVKFERILTLVRSGLAALQGFRVTMRRAVEA